MDNDLHLEIKKFGKILYANIKINKINIVGGVNSSGKSTASKLLYSFLKANSLNRIEYVKENVIQNMNNIINIVANPQPFGEHGLSPKFTIKDDFREILEEYVKAKEKFYKIKDMFEIADIFEDIINYTDDMIKIILKDEREFSPKIVKSILDNEYLSKFEGISNFYGDSFRCSIISDFYLLKNEMEYNKKEYADYGGFNFFQEGKGFYASTGSFDFLTDVFYIDAFSIFDMKFEGLRYPEHIRYLMNNLSDIPDSNEFTEGINEIQQKIEDMSKGYFDKSSLGFSFVPIKSKEKLKTKKIEIEGTILEIPLNNKKFVAENVSSGIKQISIVELLLSNRKLKPGTFLIIDEPEVNLHPEWQFKFAEILVLLAKELDVVLYLNSHSPMFIESMDAFASFYDMEDDINYYLTEESAAKGKYVFKRIGSNELYKIYDNLGNAYKLVDQLRLQKQFE